ncbi:MAG: NADH-quinone oxidoreductase subunit NuoF [Deltaproteobacteria bacterium]|jgi:NADH-quinone oxidoreductase subunit F|nr:NADH-quinone oxidoreductase subunit NuoF [Deltaproteobacteria bacterium]
MLKSRQELKDLREKCERAAKDEVRKILVCSGTGCVASGATDVYDRFKGLLAQLKIPCSVSFIEDGHGVGLKRSGCQALCEKGVLVRVEPEGYLYTKVGVDDCESIVRETIEQGRHVERLAYRDNLGGLCKRVDDIPFFKKQLRLVLENCGNIDAESFLEYLSVGGYSSFEKALFDMEPQAVIEEIAESRLRGRGGGGFPTGTKWRQVARQDLFPKYVVCNGDEGDPGAFMDCSIMEGDPHRMLEGMLIAGRAVGASEGYIYVRAEYPLAVRRLRKAIADLEANGLSGEDILGSGFSFRFRLNRGAGAFVCGEGSALTASIEGKRGFPRVKPPRTVEHGLFDKPTVLNNVETFANVTVIIGRGADFYKKIGTESSPGTKAFSITGNIENTGLIEVPLGMTLKEVIYDVGGGMKGGKRFKAVQIGGPSGACLTEAHFDLPLDFDSLAKAGAMIGSGGLVVADEDTCLVELARFFMNFTQRESCGKCVPCREGTKRMLMILERIVSGNGRPTDLDNLLDLAGTIKATALCGLGKTAPSPVISTITNFREEYLAHIMDKRCPAHSCEKLKKYYIEPELCKGCSKCQKLCPSNAISGKVKETYSIDQFVCSRCGACVPGCKFMAIKEAW